MFLHLTSNFEQILMILSLLRNFGPSLEIQLLQKRNTLALWGKVYIFWNFFHPIETHFLIFCRGGLVLGKEAKKWPKTSTLDPFLTSVALLDWNLANGLLKALPCSKFRNSNYSRNYTWRDCWPFSQFFILTPRRHLKISSKSMLHFCTFLCFKL